MYPFSRVDFPRFVRLSDVGADIIRPQLPDITNAGKSTILLCYVGGAVKKGRKQLPDSQPRFKPGQKSRRKGKKAKKAPFPNNWS